MLAEGGEIVKVADFGLALDTSDDTMYHSGEVCNYINFACLSVTLFVCHFVCLSVCWFVSLLVSLFVCMFVY